MEVLVNKNLKRIDKFLSEETEYSRSVVQKMIESDFIVVNGFPTKANYVVRENDLITINEEYKEETNVVAEVIPLDIIYEDDDLMVINKPSGMVVHPGNGNNSGTLVNALMGYTEELSDDDLRPGIVHRIDKDTSGLMLVAKNNKAHKYLQDLLKNRKITRKYLALVHGVVKYDTGTIDAPIGRSSTDRKKYMVTNENSKPALTHFKVLKRYHKHTLLECELITGRTHQIRAHLEYIAHPIVGDPVYSNRKSDKQIKNGQFLHASTLEFKLPNEEIKIEAKLPTYFTDFLKTLEEYHE